MTYLRTYRTHTAILFLIALLVIVPASAMLSPQSATADANLIVNGSLDIQTAQGMPEGWVSAGYDDNGNFATNVEFASVAGHTGAVDDYAVEVAISAPISGDAKWVPVTSSIVVPGAMYTYSNWYKSNTVSDVLAELTYGDSAHYVALATEGPTAGAWKQVLADFSVPNATAPISVRIFHVIKEVGVLATDEHLLVPSSGSLEGSLPFPVVSLTFDDGWTSQYENALPKLQGAGFPATFYVMSTPTLHASYDLIAVQSNEPGGTQATISPQGTTWSPIYRDPTARVYRFSDIYTGSASTITVHYTLVGGVASSTSLSLPASIIPTRSEFVFGLALGALEPGVPITISHTASTGTLSVSDGSLMIYESGYMNSLQVRQLASMGHEIGAHTENHCSLRRLVVGNIATCAFPPSVGATVQSEIEHSAQLLQTLAHTSVHTIAYPYGEYNAFVQAAVESAGLVGGRTVDSGYNRTTAQKLALKTQTVDNTTTLAMVQGWVEHAKANNLWLILVFHQVDDPATIASNGETGGVSTATFNAIIDYLQGQSATVSVKTVKDTLSLLGTPIPPPPPTDTTPPVITLFGSASLSLQASSTATYVDMGASATDAVDGSVPVTSEGSVNLRVAGIYRIVYRATDTAGNVAQPVARVITVTPAPQPPARHDDDTDEEEDRDESDEDDRNTPPRIECTQRITQNLYYMSRYNSQSQVRLLQQFLNEHEGERVPITGIYGGMTRDALNRFQSKYASRILSPAGYVRPTGHVGEMTRLAINRFLCERD